MRLLRTLIDLPLLVLAGLLRVLNFWPWGEQVVAHVRYLIAGGEALRMRHQLPPKALVLDLGGYLGDFAAEMRSQHDCQVWVFEPVPEFYEKIKTRFKHDKKVKVFCLGLGARRETLEFGVDGLGSGAFTPSAKTVKVKIVDAASFLKSKRVRHIHLLKANIEGGEYDLLDCLASAGWLPRIDQFLIQFHRIGPESGERMGRLQKAFSEGHESVWSFRWIWELWSNRAFQNRKNL